MGSSDEWRMLYRDAWKMASSMSQQHPGTGQTPAAKQPVEDLATPLTDCWLLCLGPPPARNIPQFSLHVCLGNSSSVVADTFHKNAFSTVPHF